MDLMAMVLHSGVSPRTQRPAPLAAWHPFWLSAAHCPQASRPRGTHLSHTMRQQPHLHLATAAIRTVNQQTAGS